MAPEKLTVEPQSKKEDASELDDGRLLLTPRETAHLLGVTLPTLWKLSHRKAGNNRLPSYKIRANRKYRKDELLWWLENQRA